MRLHYGALDKRVGFLHIPFWRGNVYDRVKYDFCLNFSGSEIVFIHMTLKECF